MKLPEGISIINLCCNKSPFIAYKLYNFGLKDEEIQPYYFQQRLNKGHKEWGEYRFCLLFSCRDQFNFKLPSAASKWHNVNFVELHFMTSLFSCVSTSRAHPNSPILDSGRGNAEFWLLGHFHSCKNAGKTLVLTKKTQYYPLSTMPFDVLLQLISILEI